MIDIHIIVYTAYLVETSEKSQSYVQVPEAGQRDSLSLGKSVRLRGRDATVYPDRIGGRITEMASPTLSQCTVIWLLGLLPPQPEAGASRIRTGSLRDYMTHFSFALPMAQKDRTDPSVGRSRVRESEWECGTSGHAAAH